MKTRTRLTILIVLFALFVSGCIKCLQTPRGVKCLRCEGGVCQASYIEIYCKFPPRPGAGR